MVAPDFTALDHYERPRTLYEFRGTWALLEFGAVWCPPCLKANRDVIALLQHMEEQGVPFTYVCCLLQDGALQPARAGHAENWQMAFGLGSNPVLHPGGEASSTVYSEFEAYAAANNVAAAIPLYVLVDPEGVIRWFATGWNAEDDGGDDTLPQLLAAIDPTLPLPAPGIPSFSTLITDANVSFGTLPYPSFDQAEVVQESFALADGPSNAVQFDFTYNGANGPGGLGQAGGSVTESVSISPVVVNPGDPPEEWLPNFVFDGDTPVTIDLTPAAWHRPHHRTATGAVEMNGFEAVVAPFQLHDEGIRFGPFSIGQSGYSFLVASWTLSWLTPYYNTGAVEQGVEASAISGKAKKKIASILLRARQCIAGENFAKAEQNLNTAILEMLNAGAPTDVINHATRLSNQLHAQAAA